jgi:hypothetical protein
MSIFAVGQRVIYVPAHAGRDLTHPDCDRGRVTSIGRDGIVFVKFDIDVARAGEGATGKGCRESSLRAEQS